MSKLGESSALLGAMPQQIPEQVMASSSSMAALLSHQRVLPKNADGLNFPRLVGAVCIIQYHFGENLPPFRSFRYWAVHFLSFYFVLSGFVAAYSRLHKGNPPPPTSSSDMLRAMLPDWRVIWTRRLPSVYPVYACGLALTLFSFNGWSFSGIMRFAEFPFFHELFLLQAWDYNLSMKNIQPWNFPDWYVSAIAGCWLLEPFFFELAAHLNRHDQLHIGALGCVLWAIVNPYCQCPLIPFYPKAKTEYDRWWCDTLGPSCFHQVFAGVLLAFVLHTRAARGDATIPWLASMSLLLCPVVATCYWWIFQLQLSHLEPPWQFTTDPPSDSQWGRRCGIFIPLQCLFIWGIVEGEGSSDPVVRVCSLWPLNQSHRIAYGVYIMQLLVNKLRYYVMCEILGFELEPVSTGAFNQLMFLLCAVLIGGGVQLACERLCNCGLSDALLRFADSLFHLCVRGRTAEGAAAHEPVRTV